MSIEFSLSNYDPSFGKVNTGRVLLRTSSLPEGCVDYGFFPALHCEPSYDTELGATTIIFCTYGKPTPESPTGFWFQKNIIDYDTESPCLWVSEQSTENLNAYYDPLTLNQWLVRRIVQTSPPGFTLAFNYCLCVDGIGTGGLLTGKYSSAMYSSYGGNLTGMSVYFDNVTNCAYKFRPFSMGYFLYGGPEDVTRDIGALYNDIEVVSNIDGSGAGTSIQHYSFPILWEHTEAGDYHRPYFMYGENYKLVNGYNSDDTIVAGVSMLKLHNGPGVYNNRTKDYFITCGGGVTTSGAGFYVYSSEKSILDLNNYDYENASPILLSYCRFSDLGDITKNVYVTLFDLQEQVFTSSFKFKDNYVLIITYTQVQSDRLYRYRVLSLSDTYYTVVIDYTSEYGPYYPSLNYLNEEICIVYGYTDTVNNYVKVVTPDNSNEFTHNMGAVTTSFRYFFAYEDNLGLGIIYNSGNNKAAFVHCGDTSQTTDFVSSYNMMFGGAETLRHSEDFVYSMRACVRKSTLKYFVINFSELGFLFSPLPSYKLIGSIASSTLGWYSVGGAAPLFTLTDYTWTDAPFYVTETTPVDEAENTSLTTNISVTFNVRADLNSFSDSIDSLYVTYEDNGTHIPWSMVTTINPGFGNNPVVINPTLDFNPNKRINVSCGSDLFSYLTETNIDPEYQFQFNTGGASVTPPTSWTPGTTTGTPTTWGSGKAPLYGVQHFNKVEKSKYGN